MTLFLIATLAATLTAFSPLAAAADWQRHWAIPPGFTLEVDASGFILPVSIAMVPEPGSAPDDPAYYVAELGGRILVVRNDRRVEVFADDFFTLEVDAQMPELAGVIGLTGLCLDAATGYLFAAYVHDTAQGRFNGVTRFSTQPRRFSLRPDATLPIHQPFTLGDSQFTRFPFGHQAGQCQVIGNTLYIGIGDGELTHRPRSDQSSFGKLLHMTLDGLPVNGTPASQAGVADFIFASGLRNPFGQTRVGEHIVVADNGPGVDRVLQVRKGRDYLYDGSDASIATNAMAVLSPARGTAHIAYIGQPPAALPLPAESLLVVISGVPEVFSDDERPEISLIEIEPDSLHVKARPRSLVRYTGNTLQVLSALAPADDGLYFAPVYSEQGTAAPGNVYRLRRAAEGEQPYPNIVGLYRNPKAILRDNGCRGCHTINGKGGNIGPALDRQSLLARNLDRVNSPAFETLLREMNTASADPTAIAARERILAAQGQQRLTTWLTEKILDPTIDNDHSIMPLLNISPTESKSVVRFLLRPRKGAPAR